MAAKTDDSGKSGRARYVMIGGFLGAGKTTAVGRLARRLTDQGLRVGLITNDQGNGLVDTSVLASQGFSVEEIAGGCFCCRFNSLVEAARKLSVASRPDVFLAEPVGSCTDLVATVSYPLRRIYGDSFEIAPLSVLIDPIRAMRVLGLEEGGRFSDKVIYIYRKQLEEADFIVINKVDLIESSGRERLREALAGSFPHARVFEVSARNGEGLDLWFEAVASPAPKGRSVMDVDYEIYAEGEALLGWLNATLAVTGEEAFDANDFLRRLAAELQREIVAEGGEIAHLKMTIDPRETLGGVAVINLVRNDFVPETSQELPDPMRSGELILNVRAELDPERLRSAVDRSLGSNRAVFPGVRLEMRHVEHFRPGRPVPTHREGHG
jgi:G3E family GTPase